MLGCNYFLVNNKRVLLNWNKILQTWVPIGGHINLGESPLEAIRREVEEEVGFEFDL
ncbi:MAG: NUDIX domain-containing protein [Nanoarchaeota archaeon]|nr:NUDIX domain-containing protein [Nanoarchaeota archaeon]MBU1027524.1 NUDIX domain-containing protein [Nanoarchaeota archaeon]